MTFRNILLSDSCISGALYFSSLARKLLRKKFQGSQVPSPRVLSDGPCFSIIHAFPMRRARTKVTTTTTTTTTTTATTVAWVDVDSWRIYIEAGSEPASQNSLTHFRVLRLRSAEVTDPRVLLAFLNYFAKWDVCIRWHCCKVWKWIFTGVSSLPVLRSSWAGASTLICVKLCHLCHDLGPVVPAQSVSCIRETSV